MTEGRQSVTVQEAARLLATTEGGIRKRVQRGSLASEKDGQGRVYVWVDAGQPRQDERQDTGQTEIGVEQELRARVESLERSLEHERRANDENRRIIAGLTQRIPQLDAAEQPGDARDAGQEESPAPESWETGSEEDRTADRRPWWRRLLGG